MGAACFLSVCQWLCSYRCELIPLKVCKLVMVYGEGDNDPYRLEMRQPKGRSMVCGLRDLVNLRAQRQRPSKSHTFAANYLHRPLV